MIFTHPQADIMQIRGNWGRGALEFTLPPRSSQSHCKLRGYSICEFHPGLFIWPWKCVVRWIKIGGRQFSSFISIIIIIIIIMMILSTIRWCEKPHFSLCSPQFGDEDALRHQVSCADPLWRERPTTLSDGDKNIVIWSINGQMRHFWRGSEHFSIRGVASSDWGDWIYDSGWWARKMQGRKIIMKQHVFPLAFNYFRSI